MQKFLGNDKQKKSEKNFMIKDANLNFSMLLCEWMYRRKEAILEYK